MGGERGKSNPYRGVKEAGNWGGQRVVVIKSERAPLFCPCVSAPSLTPPHPSRSHWLIYNCQPFILKIIIIYILIKSNQCVHLNLAPSYILSDK